MTDSLLISQIRIMADFARDSPDGWAYLNEHGRAALKKAVSKMERMQKALEEICRCTDQRAGSGNMPIFKIASEGLQEQSHEQS